MILLTQSTTPVIGQVAWLLGKIMEGIFTVIDFLGVPSIGLSIILFTIVVYLLMMPLTIKQQKFSKLSARMSPELQAIQRKYKGKTDNESAMKQNQEIQALYAKPTVHAIITSKIPLSSLVLNICFFLLHTAKASVSFVIILNRFF